MKRFSTVDWINLASAVAGLAAGVFFVLPVVRRLFPGSDTAAIIAVLWCGGFGYFCGYLLSLIYVSRKLRNK